MLSESVEIEMRRKNGLLQAKNTAEASVKNTKTQIAAQKKQYGTARKTAERLENGLTALRIAGEFPEESVANSSASNPLAENDPKTIQSKLKTISSSLENTAAKLGLTEQQIFSETTSIPLVVENTRSQYSQMSADIESALDRFGELRSIGGFPESSGVDPSDELIHRNPPLSDIRIAIDKAVSNGPALEEELQAVLTRREKEERDERERREKEEREEQKRREGKERREKARREKEERDEQARRVKEEREKQELLRLEAERQKKLRRTWWFVGISITVVCILVLLIIYNDTARTVAKWVGLLIGFSVAVAIVALALESNKEK